ncbi:Uncharacterized protein SCG7109_BC_00020 [Chlamydiales bacterium SCGC AG-110-M15]|nr:Uncharacterized protein SCG7109_BC_00020 [Chlamydiales bacterium SCGC AG-110-M15]
MDISVARAKLKPKIERRLINHELWLGKYFLRRVFTARMIKQFFPYEIASKASATVLRDRFRPLILADQYPLQAGNARDKNFYLVNVPLVAGKTKRETQDKIKSLVKKVKKGTSAYHAKRRIAIVVGVNRWASLDTRVNSEFADQIRELRQCTGAVRHFGFLWEPKWQRKEGLSYRVYTVKKAYRLLRVLFPRIAPRLPTILEQGKVQNELRYDQIPYQGIREAVFKSDETRDFVNFSHQQNLDTYLSILDGDVVSMDSLYQSYDKAIKEYCDQHHHLPDALSSGYNLKNDENVVLKRAVEMDMAVRAATSKHIPLGPYFPEPNVLFRIDLAQYLRNAYSFLGQGVNLESKRFIENAVASGAMNIARALFLTMAPVITSTPDRFYTDKVEGITQITAANIKNKSMLQSLRGVRQGHAFPKQWADSIYTVLPISTKVTNVTGPLMRIFNVFHPISVIIAWSKQAGDRYSSADYDIVMGFYDSYHTHMLNAIAHPNQQQDILNAFALTVNEDSRDQAKTLFQNQFNIYVANKNALITVGLDEATVEKCKLAAVDSSQAIYQILNAV